MDRGGGYPGVVFFKQRGGTGCADVWIRVVVHVGSNGEDGGGYARRVPVTYRGEAVTAKIIWDVGDTGGG